MTDPARDLATLLEQAKDIPLLRNSVRIEPVEAKRLSQELLDTAEPTSSLRLLAEEVRQAIMRAKQVPMTDQVRLRRDEAADLAQRLRASTERL